ncbi:YadA-like family protein [Xanthomonas perforans]|uniref:YadA-like family protein n=2 Tax=Xanthomonas TaxID=338 RepID=UPI0009BBA3A2|nr:YadA-like family protein [Xanthomonas perforans]MBZ2436265.1 YadA-like family protein [Xanthomonas perforans]MBZ2461378.1 YadA-like family protein [Xanthomonas perforans]MBZ2482804.1 YadA-like family protein [Xanthomonas perforans]MBZ2491372.1 YadA-like family protein [Xanthomonas perforans]MBZ2495739.1 YadA-like family protein [Xanthomonas perforans]
MNALKCIAMLALCAAAAPALAQNTVDSRYPEVTMTGEGNVISADPGFTQPGIGGSVGSPVVVVGRDNTAHNSASFTVVGDQNQIGQSDVVVVGQLNEISNVYGNVVGDVNNVRSNSTSTATLDVYGSGNDVSGNQSVVVGSQTTVRSSNSVTLGNGSTNYRNNTVSVGAEGAERQIIHVAAGQADTDAVNVRQMNASDELTLQGANAYTDRAASLEAAARDAADAVTLGTANAYTNRTARIEAVARAAGDVATLDSANNYTDRATAAAAKREAVSRDEGDAATLLSAKSYTDATALQYDDPSKSAMTLRGVSGTLMRNVSDGIEGMDAVNVRQMQAGDANTLRAANAYTDTRVSDLSDDFFKYRAKTDADLSMLNHKVDRQAAVSAAMMNMAMNAAGADNTRGRLSAGVGWSGGQEALSLGYAKRIGRISLSIGGGFSGDESTAGIGFGVDL